MIAIRLTGVSIPLALRTASAPAMMAMASVTHAISRLRSSTSASTPAGSDTNSTGIRLAACTIEASAAAWG